MFEIKVRQTADEEYVEMTIMLDETLTVIVPRRYWLGLDHYKSDIHVVGELLSMALQKLGEKPSPPCPRTGEPSSTCHGSWGGRCTA